MLWRRKDTLLYGLPDFDLVSDPAAREKYRIDLIDRYKARAGREDTVLMIGPVPPVEVLAQFPGEKHLVYSGDQEALATSGCLPLLKSAYRSNAVELEDRLRLMASIEPRSVLDGWINVHVSEEPPDTLSSISLAPSRWSYQPVTVDQLLLWRRGLSEHPMVGDF